MTHRTVLLLTATALAAVFARPASADVSCRTFTGTASGTNGVFGTPGAALNSVAFTSTYTYDPSQFGNAYQVLQAATQTSTEEPTTA